MSFEQQVVGLAVVGFVGAAAYRLWRDRQKPSPVPSPAVQPTVIEPRYYEAPAPAPSPAAQFLAAYGAIEVLGREMGAAKIVNEIGEVEATAFREKFRGAIAGPAPAAPKGPPQGP